MKEVWYTISLVIDLLIIVMVFLGVSIPLGGHGYKSMTAMQTMVEMFKDDFGRGYVYGMFIFLALAGIRFLIIDFKKIFEDR